MLSHSRWRVYGICCNSPVNPRSSTNNMRTGCAGVVRVVLGREFSRQGGISNGFGTRASPSAVREEVARGGRRPE